MLTGHEKALTLIFYYPEFEGKKTSPQVYVRVVIRRQQELMWIQLKTGRGKKLMRKQLEQ